MTKDEVVTIAEQIFDQRFAKWKWLGSGFLIGFGALVVLGVAWPRFRDFVLGQIVTDEIKESIWRDPTMRGNLAEDVIGQLGERVDSGYARTIYFGSGTGGDPSQALLEFYARPQQRVSLAVRALSKGAGGEYTITVDNHDLFKGQQQRPVYPYPYFVTVNIDEKFLNENATPLDIGDGGNIHVARVVLPTKLNGGTASFELVVLVRNKNAAKKT